MQISSISQIRQKKQKNVEAVSGDDQNTFVNESGTVIPINQELLKSVESFLSNQDDDDDVSLDKLGQTPKKIMKKITIVIGK